MIWHLLIQFLKDTWTNMRESESNVEVWSRRSDSRAKKIETLRLIKQAAYDLQIGPCEILQPRKDPSTFEIKFKGCMGTEQHVFLPISSNYTLIEEAMVFAGANSFSAAMLRMLRSLQSTM